MINYKINADMNYTHHIGHCGMRPSFLSSDQQPGIDELIGKQRTIFILKDGLELESTCGRVDLIVQCQKRSGRELFLLAAIKSVHGHTLPLAQLRLDLRQIVLGHGKDHRDRLKLGHDDQGGGAVGLDNIAGIDEAQAHSAFDRGSNMAIHQV